MRLEIIPWTRESNPDEDELRRRLEDEGFQVFHWSDAAGTDYPPHSHDYDESLWVIRGEIIFGTGGQELRLRSGDRLMLPKGAIHTARTGASGAVYLIGEK